MAIPKLLADLAIISKLKENPRADGLSAEGFQKKFDEAALLIQKFLNESLIPELDKIVDVQALLNGILDNTLTAADKAAPAKEVGDRLKNLASVYHMARLFERTVKSAICVFVHDQSFRAEAVTLNKVRIYGGSGMIQGNYFELNVGNYADVDVADGLAGAFRHDLICIRYERTEDGHESHSVILLPGTQQTKEGVDPEYNTADINLPGAVVRDMPIYRVKLNGVNYTLEPMFSPLPPLKEYIDNKHFIKTATLKASGWTGSAAPYTQSISVDGVTTKGSVHVSPVWPNTQEGDAAMQEACALITHAKRSASKVTFTCREAKPATDIPVEVEVFL